VDIDTSAGAGTSVRLLFPIDPGITIAARGPEVVAASVTGTENLLLVEDEQSLREALSTILSEAGYSVRVAEGGIEAVDSFVSNPDVDLVLMDLGLPDIPGTEAFERMRGIRPSVRCIVVSGNLDAKQRSLLYEAGVRAAIRKPFRTAELLETVRRVLDAPSLTEIRPQEN
jgi:DNA-binding response OmpR family regulator